MNVTTAQLAIYLGVGPAGFDQARAELLLGLAVEACEEIVDPLPDKARGVVLDVAANAYVASPGPGGAQTAGPYTATIGPGGVTLSKRQIVRLKRLSGRPSGAFTINPLSDLPRAYPVAQSADEGLGQWWDDDELEP